MKNYRAKINMYRLDVSNADDFKQSGATDQALIKAFALENLPSLDFNQNDQIIFVIESVAHQKDSKYISGLTRADPNIVQLETANLDNVVHEFGHSFGRLYDEDVKVTIPDWKSDYPNIATIQPGDSCDDRWKDLNNIVIDAPGIFIESELWRISRIVDCYDATGIGFEVKGFRPTNEACIMKQVWEHFPFCPVCQRQMVKQLSKYTLSDDRLYHQVETFEIPSEFKEATINPLVINFDYISDLYPRYLGLADWDEPVFKIDAPLPGVPASRLYAQSGVSFTSGVIFEVRPHLSASEPNVLGATTLNPVERALIAGYFFSRRICALGIYNTGSTSVTLRTYNAGFRESGYASAASNADTKPFIGIRATEPIYRFEIDAPSAEGFSVDDLTFGACPK